MISPVPHPPVFGKDQWKILLRLSAQGQIIDYDPRTVHLAYHYWRGKPYRSAESLRRVQIFHNRRHVLPRSGLPKERVTISLDGMQTDIHYIEHNPPKAGPIAALLRLTGALVGESESLTAVERWLNRPANPHLALALIRSKVLSAAKKALPAP